MNETRREQAEREPETGDFLNACLVTRALAFSPALPAARVQDDGSPLPPSRSRMSHPNTAPAIRHALPRNVYSQPYGDGEVFFYVTSDGTEGRYRFPMP